MTNPFASGDYTPMEYALNFNLGVIERVSRSTLDYLGMNEKDRERLLTATYRLQTRQDIVPNGLIAFSAEKPENNYHFHYSTEQNDQDMDRCISNMAYLMVWKENSDSIPQPRRPLLSSTRSTIWAATGGVMMGLGHTAFGGALVGVGSASLIANTGFSTKYSQASHDAQVKAVTFSEKFMQICSPIYSGKPDKTQYGAAALMAEFEKFDAMAGCPKTLRWLNRNLGGVVDPAENDLIRKTVAAETRELEYKQNKVMYAGDQVMADAAHRAEKAGRQRCYDILAYGG